MAVLRYAVLQVGNEWRVVCSRRRIGRFETRAQAVHAGAGLAREALASGHEVEFLVQDLAGLLVAESFQPPRPQAEDSRSTPAPT